MQNIIHMTGLWRKGGISRSIERVCLHFETLKFLKESMERMAIEAGTRNLCTRLESAAIIHILDDQGAASVNEFMIP